MKGPLHSCIYDTARHVESWWEASAPAPAPRPALDSEVIVDVAIIGGGYAGLSAGLRLAELGQQAAVLDAAETGWGASGRNGGIVGFGGAKRSKAALRRLFGQDALDHVHRLQTEGLGWLRAFAEGAGLGEQVQGTGELILAHSPKAARGLFAEADASGGAITRIPPSGLGDMAQFGGHRETPAFGVHPLRLVRAQADAAAAAGALVFPRSEVLAWERPGNMHRLVTAGGAVRAARVLLATNGFTPDGLHEGFRARAVPVISNIGVTRVLSPEERARHPWLGDDPANDTRHLLAYFRMLPEGRLLYGMRGDALGSPAGAERMRRKLAARIAASFPGWAEAEIEYFWRGPVCATARLTPAVGALADEPTVFHAFGWHGSGINMGTLSGRLIADVISSGDQSLIPAPWRGLPARLPLARLRPAYVAMAMGGYKLADLMR